MNILKLIVRLPIPVLCPYRSGMLAIAIIAVFYVTATAQTRQREVTRGTYQPPVLRPIQDSKASRPQKIRTANLQGTNPSPRTKPLQQRGQSQRVAQSNLTKSNPTTHHVASRNGQSDHQIAEPEVVHPTSYNVIDIGDEPSVFHEGNPHGPGLMSAGCHDGAYCDSMGCGPSCGCDACGPVGCAPCHPCFGYGLPWHRLFGTLEYSMVWRTEQFLPPLITSSPAGTNVANAGVLGQASTDILVGGRYRSEMTSGGRAQLGIWMDDIHCNSILLRFWASGRETMSFSADQTDDAFVAVPFNNAANNGTPTSLLVVEPQQAQGSVNIQTRSELYGGDALLRRLCRTGLGGRLDAFWGYQTARINEDLTIAIDTVGLEGGNREGQRLQINDVFDAKNEFHGGTFGYEGFYREGCWSWHLLTKLGLGSMQRTATIRGNTTRTSGGISALDDQGFFARDTNIGIHRSSKFSVAPEINLTLGYLYRPGMDFTIGYNYQLFTNAIQPGQLIDTTTTDLNDPTITRPRVVMQNQDYFIHSLNFGFNWHY